MSVQYSGNAQTSSFTPAVRQDIINSIETALLAAGWTTVSGHSTTNLLMQSAVTPQGFAMRVRLKDNGGNCVNFSIESTDGVIVGDNTTNNNGGSLDPSRGMYRIICNKYQAFVYTTPFTANNNSFVAFGVPYVPATIAALVTRIGWMQSNSHGDSSGDYPLTCFRCQLCPTNAAGFNLSNQQMMLNALFSGAYNQGGDWAQSGIGLMGLQLFSENRISTGYRWLNGQAVLYDAIIGWATTGFGNNAEGRLVGQLWDAVVASDTYNGDMSMAFDTHNWATVTHNGPQDNYSIRGTLILATS